MLHTEPVFYLLAELLWKKLEPAPSSEAGPQVVKSPSVQMPAAICALLCWLSPAVMQLSTFRRRGRAVIQQLLICCCLSMSSDAKGRMWRHKYVHIKKLLCALQKQKALSSSSSAPWYLIWCLMQAHNPTSTFSLRCSQAFWNISGFCCPVSDSCLDLSICK